MRILWQGLVDSGSSWTSYSVDANYPLSNLYDIRLSRQYRTSGMIGTSTEYIKVGESSIAPQYFAMVNHNVSSSATITLEGASSSGMSTLTWTQTLTWSSYTLTSTITSTVNCNYFRLKVSGLSTTTQTYISMGYFFLGNYLEMPGMRPDQSIADETTSKVSITPSGQVYADDGYIFRSGTINFPYITQAQRDSLRDMYAIVKDHTPVIMIIWPSNTAEETPIYALVNQNNLKFTRTDDVNYRWATTLNFREVF